MKMTQACDVLLTQYMQRIYDRGLTTMSGGNLSVMDADGSIWITPSGIDKGALKPCDMIRVDRDGNCFGPHKPSCELPLHSDIYRLRPDIKAVLHAHSPALVAFAIARKMPELRMIPAIGHICPTPIMARYDVPGSTALGKKVSAVFAEGGNVAMMENHGVCIGAQTMETAFGILELLEAAAATELLARKLGAPRVCEPKAETFSASAAASASIEAHKERDALIGIVRRCYRTGLFTALQGNCSVKLPGGLLITPPDGDRAGLEADDLLCYTDDTPLCGIAALHAAIYRRSPETRAVISAQPVHAMAFAVTNAEFDVRTIPESYIQLRNVARASSDASDADIAALLAPSSPTVLVENRGLITTGSSLLQAFDRLEVAEFTARSILDSLPLGQIVHISAQEVDEIKQAFALPD